MGSSNLFGMLFFSSWATSWATERDSTPLGQWLKGRMPGPALVALYQEFGVFHHVGEWHTASMLWPSGSKMKAP